MRGGRLLLIVGVVILLAALAVGGYMLLGDGLRPTPTEEAEPGEVATPVPEGTVQIVVAVQTIPRGMTVTEDDGAVAVRSWPEDAVPEDALTDPKAVYGKITRVEVVRGMPVLEGMLTDQVGDMGARGSDAALQIPEGKVAYAMPIARYSSVAGAVQPGDHVDVMISLLMVDLDEELQSILPNEATCISPAEGEGCQGGVLGRLEALPNGWLVNLIPSDGQRPRLVTQLMVQDLLVLQVDDWPAPGAPSPRPEEAEVQTDEGGEQPTPVPPSNRVRPVTLAVSRQQAIALEHAQAAGARINLVLRGVNDGSRPTTDSVTLRYLMEQFNVEVPPKLPYGLTPPISELERIAANEAAAQYGSPAPVVSPPRE